MFEASLSRDTMSAIGRYNAAMSVMTSRCFKCHSEWSGWKQPDWIANGMVVAQKPEASKLFLYIRGNKVAGSIAAMPPDSTLAANEIDYIRSWIAGITQEGTIANSGFSCDPNRAPAATRLYRLSKNEYTNAIRDLLSYQFGAAANSNADATRRESLAQSAYNLISSQLTLIKEPPQAMRYKRFDNSMESSEVLAYAQFAGRLGLQLARPDTGSSSNFSDLFDFFGSCSNSFTGNVVRESLGSQWNLVDGANSQSSCLNQFIQRFGQLAFRRPVTETERASIFKVYVDSVAQTSVITGNSGTGGSPRVGLSTLVMRILTSVPFIYHLYLPVTNPEVNERYTFLLDAYSLVSRLAFHFWESIPDETLLDLAQSGAIFTSNGYQEALDHLIKSQVGRSKMRPVIRRFFYEWMNLNEVPRIDTNTSVAYQNFTQGYSTTDLIHLRTQSQDEIMNMGEYYAFDKSDGTFGDLFESKRSFATGSVLARAYGVSSWNRSGEGVAFPSTDPRGGLLNRSAFLINAGVSNRIIIRGVHIRKNILCDPLDPPPPNVTPPNNLDLGSFPTTRQVITETTKAGACFACHSRINPLAFPLEHFDSLGRFRGSSERVYNLSNANVVSFMDRTLDTGSIPAIDTTDLRSASSLNHYNSMIIESGKPQSCFARGYFSFSFRREERLESDGCALESLKKAATQGTLEDVMRAIADTDSFKMRSIPL